MLLNKIQELKKNPQLFLRKVNWKLGHAIDDFIRTSLWRIDSCEIVNQKEIRLIWIKEKR
ncbi:hypothetical protein WH8501_04280 [Crocosphaera watsonii WH 8501]|uniref:Uncharacterized protein n=2 Tax=Crocosphaera watsonii TaxID=263511 RepID=T2JEW6_CROWT|nr:hypothetical protein [Crocosphaera watsonii]CCQ52078.1 hypothetical protein CWATWH8502_2785 [Crocosphaera watsonii WH 8502]CCQ64373.1 hypothetical protein CWATWH0401_3304 [Crocosphaera watsonii WH 0401]